jgi:membrane protease YdiL (CAAX protease family)
MMGGRAKLVCYRWWHAATPHLAITLEVAPRMEPTSTDSEASAPDPGAAPPSPGEPAAVVPEPPPRPAAVWRAIPGAVLFYLGGALVGTLLAVLVRTIPVVGRGAPSSAGSAAAGLMQAMHQPGFLALTLMLSAVFTVVFVLLGVRNADRPWRERLGLVRGRVPGREVPFLVLVCLGALAVGLVGAIGLHRIGWLPEIGRSRQEFGLAFKNAGLAILVALVFSGSVLTGLAEELVFRGYLQRALQTRWRPALAVGVSSAMFILMHGDAAYDVFVLPVGFLLGYIAWRADSIVPTIVCHVTVNALGQSYLAFSSRQADRLQALGLGGTPNLHASEHAWLGATTFAAGLALIVLGVRRVERSVGAVRQG